jgi:formamidopyrimidine-DNA glycosylase
VPELPEVETVVRSLRPHVVGRKIVAVEVGTRALRDAWQAQWAGEIVGRRMTEVRRRGKWILIPLTPGDSVLVLHLGMTGRLSVQKPADPRTGHTHVVFSLDRDRELRFHDPRRFGSVTLLPDLATLEERTKLGPEPFEAAVEAFHETLHRSKRSLKAILMDQGVLAGVGNIYADESLFEAKLNPRRRGTSIKRAESARLLKAVVKVLNRAIAAKGSTISDFYFGEGEQGGYQTRFLVYGRTKEACRRCRTLIRRIVLGGRSTHYCPRCQGAK